jgi:DNA-binding PadR family transcriptional regulator
MSPRRSVALSIEHALLGFLLDEPLHGYEIHQRLQAAHALGLIWRVKQAKLYALLAKLESNQLIVAELIAQEARPPKRLLHLTDTGRTTFFRWCSAPVAHARDVRIEFLAKLFWVQQQSPAAVQHLIRVQRVATQTLLADICTVIGVEGAEHPYTWLVYQFRQGQLEAMLEWLNTCETTLIPALGSCSKST